MGLEYAILAQVLYHYGLFALKKIKHPDLQYNKEYRSITIISILITITIYCMNTPLLIYISDPWAAAGFGMNCLKGTHFLIEYLKDD